MCGVDKNCRKSERKDEASANNFAERRELRTIEGVSGEFTKFGRVAEKRKRRREAWGRCEERRREFSRIWGVSLEERGATAEGRSWWGERWSERSRQSSFTRSTVAALRDLGTLLWGLRIRDILKYFCYFF